MRCWKTRGARLTASKRLAKLHRLTNWWIMLASMLMIAATLAPVVLDWGPDAGRLLVIYNVLGSVGIIVVSALAVGKRYLADAERLEKCGIDLRGIITDVEELENRGHEVPTDEQITKLRELERRYHRIIEQSQPNHTTLDYHWFQAEEEAKGLSFRRAWLFARAYWMPIAGFIGYGLLFWWASTTS